MNGCLITNLHVLVSEVTGADDATLDVECTECGDGYTVEPDAFNDGGIKYWPEAMVEFGEEL